MTTTMVPCPVPGCTAVIPDYVWACHRCRAQCPRWLRKQVARGQAPVAEAVAHVVAKLTKAGARG